MSGEQTMGDSLVSPVPQLLGGGFMGWYRIDPKTGRPDHAARSKLSTPGFGILNAIPGVDDDSEAYYLEDLVCDSAALMTEQLRRFLNDNKLQCPPVEQLLALFLDGVVPPSFTAADPQQLAGLRQELVEMWQDIDADYRDAWGRPARREERWAACGEYLERLAARN
jgi:hypothetical protein